MGKGGFWVIDKGTRPLRAVIHKEIKMLVGYDKFFMVFVAGMRMPKVVHETIEEARHAVKLLKDAGYTKEIFIMGVVEKTAGRKILTLKPWVTVESRPQKDQPIKGKRPFKKAREEVV